MANLNSLKYFLNWKTPYARKYGELETGIVDEDRVFEGTGKSGYTPTKDFTFGEYTAYERSLNNQVEKYQVGYLLRGWTSKQLVEVGAYPDPNLKHVVLTNPLHPLFAQDLWESPTNLIVNRMIAPIVAYGDCYALGPGPLGDWHAHNPIVWTAILPVLKLASQFIANAGTSIVFEAFFCGDWSPVSDAEDPRTSAEKATGDKLWRFKPGDPTTRDVPSYTGKLAQMVIILKKCLMLGIGSGHFRPPENDPAKTRSIPWEGFTYFGKLADGTEKILVNISFEHILPLMRNDLCPAEKLACEFRLAIVLVHEFMHAVSLYMSRFPSIPEAWNTRYEAVYDKDIFIELGYALEISIMGGVNQGQPRTHPTLLNWMTSHPRRGGGKNELLLRPHTQSPEAGWDRPIESSYYGSIFSDNFWNYAVSKYGVTATRPSVGLCNVIDGQGAAGIEPQAVDLPWDNDLKAIFSDTSQVAQKLAAMIPADREALMIAYRRVAERDAMLERRDYRTNRWLCFQEIEEAHDELNIANRRITRASHGVVPDKLKVVLDLLFAQVNSEMNRVLKLARSDFNVPAEHVRFLEKSNQRLRFVIDKCHEIAQGLPTDALLDPQPGDDEKLIRDRQKALLDLSTVISMGANVTFALLHIDDKTTIQNKNPKQIFDTVRALLTDDYINNLKAAHEVDSNPRSAQSFLPELLREAQEALESGDDNTCKSIAKEIFANFYNEPYMRGVAKILISHDGVPTHRFFSRMVTKTEADALDTGFVYLRSPAEKFWRDWFEEHEKEKPKEKEKGSEKGKGKKKAGDSDSSDSDDDSDASGNGKKTVQCAKRGGKGGRIGRGGGVTKVGKKRITGLMRALEGGMYSKEEDEAEK